MKKIVILLSAVLLIACSIPVFAASDSVHRFERPKGILGKAAAQDQEDAQSQDEAIPIGEILPEVSYTTIDGETFDTAEALKEKKALLINFFQVSCPYCVEEFPLLNELAEEYSDQAAFLALDSNMYDAEEAVSEFRDQNSISFPVAQELEWELSDMIPYDGYPCTIILDKNGAMVFYQDYVIRDKDEMKEVFDTILAEDYEDGFERVHAFNDLPDEDAEAEPSGENEGSGYTIAVKDQNGDPVPNVIVNFCSDAQQTCRMDATDNNGEIFFEVPEDIYHIAILAAPEGYSYSSDSDAYTENSYGDPIQITIKKD